MPSSELVGLIDAEVHNPRWKPYCGYANSGQAAAFQQIRQEFMDFVDVLDKHVGVYPGTYELGSHTRALQLGMGLSACSHAVWRLLADKAVTIDIQTCCACRDEEYPVLDTHTQQALSFATSHSPFDILFIDAGHVYEDVQRDHDDYAPLVRKGGIVAFHDAVHRPQYDADHHVWRYLLDHHPIINRIGHEVGIAWYIK